MPFVLIDAAGEWALREARGSEEVVGGIAQIGGTLLMLCGLEVPEHYLPALVQSR